jgi:1-acyl-sn-glycerol-3-phosphate acyltransferase
MKPGGARWLWLLRPFVWALFTAAFGAPMSARGRSRVPRRGPLLVLANHISNADPVLAQWACPRHVRFMARRELFAMGRLGQVIAWFGAFPVSQGTADVGALKTALRLLGEGEAVLVFPEGKLSEDGALGALLPGAAMIAARSGAPVVCLGLRGTRSLVPYPEERPRWAGRLLQARWGEPRKFARDAAPDEVLAWVESELRRLS